MMLFADGEGLDDLVVFVVVVSAPVNPKLFDGDFPARSVMGAGEILDIPNRAKTKPEILAYPAIVAYPTLVRVLGHLISPFRFRGAAPRQCGDPAADRGPVSRPCSQYATNR